MHTYIHDLSLLLPTFFPSGLSLPLIQGFATFKKRNQNWSDSSLSGTLVFLPFEFQVLSTADEQLSQGPSDIAQVSSWCQQTSLRNSWKGGSLCLPPAPHSFLPGPAPPHSAIPPPPAELTDLQSGLPAPTPGAARGHSCCPFPLPQIPWLYVSLILKPSFHSLVKNKPIRTHSTQVAVLI